MGNVAIYIIRYKAIQTDLEKAKQIITIFAENKT